MDPEIGGWVFNCPFNSDNFPFTGSVGGMGAAAQNPDNYARYRVVDQFLEQDVITGTEVEVILIEFRSYIEEALLLFLL
jgi:hypothetical protein